MTFWMDLIKHSRHVQNWLKLPEGSIDVLLLCYVSGLVPVNENVPYF